jgi:hypothetical protein
MMPDLELATMNLLFGAGDTLARVPLLEGCGALLFDSFRALLVVVLSVGLLLLLWRGSRYIRNTYAKKPSGAAI